MKKLFAWAVLAGLAAGVSQASAEPPPAYEGRRLYVSYCQLCHGEGGKGDGPLARQMGITPADLTTTVRSRSDTILTKIITGRGGQTIAGRARHNILSEAMPDWEKVFSDDKVGAIIAYLRILSRSKHRLIGDPEVGFKLYQKYCAACHGEEGDGRGVMTAIMKFRPADHTNSIQTEALSNDDMAGVIRYGKGGFMPAWDDILTAEEIDGLVSYIRLLSY
ncbi:MAG: c-type cytochrome [Alphaproteobacteria bacterium]|nr:c-type cytochrome [Alphaproteobacteria bacterium]